MVFSSPPSDIPQRRISIMPPLIHDWEVIIKKLKRSQSFCCHILICQHPLQQQFWKREFSSATLFSMTCLRSALTWISLTGLGTTSLMVWNINKSFVNFPYMMFKIYLHSFLVFILQQPRVANMSLF